MSIDVGGLDGCCQKRLFILLCLKNFLHDLLLFQAEMGMFVYQIAVAIVKGLV